MSELKAEAFRKVNFFISPLQYERFRTISQGRGLTKAELFRRALDYWLDSEDAKHEKGPSGVSRQQGTV